MFYIYTKYGGPKCGSGYNTKYIYNMYGYFIKHVSTYKKVSYQHSFIIFRCTLQNGLVATPISQTHLRILGLATRIYENIHCKL